MKTNSKLRALALLAFVACPSASLWAAPLTSEEGNAFSFTGSSTVTASATTDEWSSFTAPTTTSATGVRIDLSAAGVGTATYGIELANSAGTGPSGTYVDSSTLTTAASGFDEIDFASSYQLTAGTVYYVVVTPSSGATVPLRVESGYSAGIQPDGYNDPNFLQGNLKGSTSALDAGDSLNYTVVTNGTLNIGNPYTAIISSNTATAAPPAEHFIFQQPSTGSSLSSVTVTLAIGASALTAPVNFTLLNNNNQVIGQASLPASAFTLNATGKYTVNFSGINLTSGAGYNLVLSTTNAANSVKWDEDNTDAVAADENATYEGTSGYAFNYSSLNATTGVAGAATLNDDFDFTFTTTASAPVAYWTGATSGSWATMNNFNTASAGGSPIAATPGSSTDVVFSTSSPTAANLNTTLDGATSINSLTFNSNSGNVTIASGTGGTASTLTLEGQTTTANGGINTAPIGITSTGSTSNTISAPVILGNSQTWSIGTGGMLTVSGQVSGIGTALTSSGGGTVVLSNATGNIYTGGTTITAGTFDVTNTSNSGTGSGAVTVGTGSAHSGTLEGYGIIAGAGVAIKGGGTLATGDRSQISGTGLSSVGGMSISSTPLTIGSGSGTANLTFILGSGTSGINGGTASGPLDFSNPNNNTTYLKLTGSTVMNFAGTTSITLVDLTNTTGANGALNLITSSAYLLVDAGSNADYSNLVIVSGTPGNLTYSLSQNDAGVNGYVAGIYTGGLTNPTSSQIAGNIGTINFSEFGADGVTPLAQSNGPGGLYDSPELYLGNGNLDLVPEPGTWAMMLGGLALLVVIQRRRNKLI